MADAEHELRGAAAAIGFRARAGWLAEHQADAAEQARTTEAGFEC